MAEEWREVVNFLGGLLEQRRKKEKTSKEIYKKLGAGIAKFHNYEGLMQFLRTQYWTNEKNFLESLRSAAYDIALKKGAAESGIKTYLEFEKARANAEQIMTEAGIKTLPRKVAAQREREFLRTFENVAGQLSAEHRRREYLKTPLGKVHNFIIGGKLLKRR